MSNVKYLSFFSAAILVLSQAAAAIEIDNISRMPHLNNFVDTPTHTHISQLKPIPSSAYKLASARFLPDVNDAEIGFNNKEFIKENHNYGNKCAGYELKHCPTHGNCSTCPFDRKYNRLNSCSSGYTKIDDSCKASSCKAIGYNSEIPTNNICTKITDSGLTCYKDCKAVSCSGYTLNYDAFNVDNAADKTMCPDCESANANCSPKLAKVSSCVSGYKIAENGISCIAKDDTCPNGYYKSCETSTQGDPKYTEKGTTCWQCKPKTVPLLLPILYSDLTTAKEIIANKTPIGVVFDESKKLAVALTDSTVTSWSTEYFDIPSLTNYSPATAAIEDWNGKNNTKTIIDYCKANSKSCPAAEYTNNYSTSGTNAGDWYLPSIGELNRLQFNKIAVNAGLTLAKGTALADTYYWSSSELDSSRTWRQKFNDSSITSYYKMTVSSSVRPVINYGDVKENCITEAEIQSGWENGEFIYRTPVGKNNFCGNPVKWEKTLCEDKTTKIFACSRSPNGPGIEYENGWLTTRGAIGWIKSQYCAGANKKSQCLSKYSSVILSPSATTELRGDINGENFSKYITDYHFNINVCDWCLDFN